MAAATQNRECLQLGAPFKIGRGKIAASTKIYANTIVARNTAGHIVPAANTAGLVVVGMSLAEFDNSAGAAGDLECEYGVGVYGFPNDTGKPIALADSGRMAYVHDDQTLCDEREGSVVEAGPVFWYDSGDDIVYVTIGIEGREYVLGEETVTSGALSLYKAVSLISVTGTQAYTLADGLYVGQIKYLRCTVAATTPDGTLTPTNLADGSTLDFDAVEEAYALMWMGTAWRVLYVIGGAIGA